jgi:hypothetical protein
MRKEEEEEEENNKYMTPFVHKPKIYALGYICVVRGRKL